ncbi:unnamed protein product [Arctia plantaginis]|uniref:Uncharacterized protein n=1 Tax=Arctia plantaginis TaxID=874455 RepID=A0A8S0Z635_ARCPL|nr:unnamed protein product [Arctia plantaginis]
MGEVPAAVALLYKESEVMVYSPMMVSNQQRGGVAGTGREEGAAERGDREEKRQGSTDRKRRNMRPAAFTLARKMLGGERAVHPYKRFCRPMACQRPLLRSSVRRLGEALLINRPLVSLLLPERVCPICVIQHLAGDRENVKLLEGQKPYLDAEALTSLVLTGSNGALEAMAAAHNQEMHALNGNINFSVVHDTARADVMAAALTRATRGVRHRHAIQVETERRLRVAQEEVPMLVYTSNVANGVGLVSAPPTRHQLFWFYGSLAQPEMAGEAPNHVSRCGEPSMGSPAPSVLETTGTAVPPHCGIFRHRVGLADEGARHLDEVMHRQTRAMTLARGETWFIDDPSIAVVVIDYASGNPQLMWALQMVLAAPYPLVEVDELFVVTGPEGAETCRLAAMRRNECCVIIDNKRRKFLLVTGSGEETSK